MGEGEVNALATQTAFLKSTEHEAIRRLDIVALIKALKDNGNSLGNPLGCSLAAYRLPLDKDQMHTDYESYSLSKDQKSQDGDKRNEAEEATNHDHEGGESETNAQEEAVSDAHDQVQEEIHVPEEEERVPESEGQERPGREEREVSEEERVEEVHVPEEVPLRRSSRVKKPPSNWANTRVYYNAHAVAHPSQATVEGIRQAHPGCH
ncbi:hypothetical protein F2Q68_00044091 [Brassica cretica]|uniref:Uncharacterized protein n=1 Tax=Brassica cretica TaxID=69181 RepID=A0A8S9LKC2_BRACR|nr:hypothetical protein F2Q68_00044091 [Brassica cretica]